MNDNSYVTSVSELKDQINIVDVVGRLVQLKRRGHNFWGVCPFHNEKTPSFSVSEDKQFFYCFGCHAKGDLIEFVQKYYNIDFSEAMDKLAGEYGIKLQKKQKGQSREKYYEINKLAARFFYEAFTSGTNRGYTYMKQRGISDSVLKKFGIGYADADWNSLYNFLLSKDIKEKDMLELGLISQKGNRYYDKFRNRVMFPIINTAGKVIGFGGRAIGDDNPKYLNSPESKIFKKKNNLYGLNLSKQQISQDGKLILVEGYMDVIGLYQGGIKNVSASLGTALTDNQAKLIKRYTDKVILSYDSDNAGRNAALRGIDILRNAECSVGVVHVTDGKDPDEFIKKQGKQAYLNLVDKAVPALDYKFQSIIGTLNLDNYEDKIQYIKRAIEILKTLSVIDREVYISRLAEMVSVPESAIRYELGDEISEQKERSDYSPDYNDGDDENFVTTYEKNLLKLVYVDACFLGKMAEYEGIITSNFAKKIFSIANLHYDNDEEFNWQSVLDALEPDEVMRIRKIVEDVKIGGKESDVFYETVKQWQYDNIERKEKEILELISMADDNGSQDIRELSNQLARLEAKKREIK